MFKPYRQGPFKPLDVGLALFLAGCVPTILMAVISYSILRGTLEERIVKDRYTLVQSVARLVNGEPTRAGEMLEYYVNTPQAQRFVLSPYGDQDAANWLAEDYYSHPRTDGMFLTDAAGRLVCAIPSSDTAPGNDFSSSHWLAQTQKASGYYVSAVFRRIPDGRLCTTIAVPVRARTGEITGYMGASVLVERIGRRLAALNFGDSATEQVLDQTGTPLFGTDMQPNVAGTPGDPGLMAKLDQSKGEHFQYANNLVTFEKIEGTNWTALLQQPLSVAYRPIHNLVGKTAIITAWLVALYAVGSWLMGWLYRNHLLAAERIVRETSFSQTMLANMPVGIALLDAATHKCLQGNAKFLEMARSFGGAPPEKPLPELHVRDLPKLPLEQAFEQVTGIGAPFHLREQPVRCGNGHTIFLSIHLAPLHDTRKRIHGLLLLLEDTTHEVETRQELIAANTAKDQFLALLSHELRNPLSPVITMVSELDKMVSTVPERNALEIIQRNVELEARLIDDLLDVTRISHGKLQLDPETIDAHRAIHRALEICQRDIDTKQLAVRLDLGATDFHVKADPARFQQVLWNLVKNAVKFTPERGSISIRSLNRDGRRLVIEVTDTGIGIEPERVARIFRPFDQGESSITRRFGGLGLGLAISKALIEAHDGTLQVQSDGMNQGATFTVELAAVDAPAVPEKAPAKPAETGAPAEHKILIVDDHEDTCTGMAMILERRGYRVKAANNVAGALEVAQTFRFDLVISDLGLPDGTGFDLIRELRRQRGDIRSVALSGFGMESDIERSLEAGFDDHLIKPVNLERLGEILRRVFPENGAEKQNLS